MSQTDAETSTSSSGAAFRTIGIESDFEIATAAGLKYRRERVYPYLKAKGWEASRFEGSQATRANVAPAVGVTGVQYITGVGHGDPNTFMGQANEVIFEVGKYDPKEPKGKIVHLASCYTAFGLGPDFVTNGCLAFFGYDADFMLVEEDADSFFACDSEVDLALAEGQTAGVAHQRAVAAFQQAISAAQAAGRLFVASLLTYDLKHFCGPGSGAQFGQETVSLT